MHAHFYQLPEEEMLNLIGELKTEAWLTTYFNQGENWIDIVRNLPSGDIYDNNCVVFFKEPFNEWVEKVLKP